MGPKTKIALAVGACIIAMIVIIATLRAVGPSEEMEVPHEGAWGIYSMDLDSKEVALLYTTGNMLQGLSLDSTGNTLAFSERFGDTNESDEEICRVAVDGSGFSRLTDNDVLDTYPAWSSDGSALYFLSWRDTTLDIFTMNPDGGSQTLFYDSGYHDADIHAVGDRVVFTQRSQIWTINTDGTGIRRVTDPPRAGEWGDANLPFGDYDPRLSPDGSQILFERLVDDSSVHGNYNLYLIGADGTEETALTATGYSQGLPSWSHDGERLVYIVAAINDQGVYHIYMMDSDGGSNRDVTPDYFPENFLCRSAVFSHDDSRLYFIGQWWSSSQMTGYSLESRPRTPDLKFLNPCHLHSPLTCVMSGLALGYEHVFALACCWNCGIKIWQQFELRFGPEGKINNAEEEFPPRVGGDGWC